MSITSNIYFSSWKYKIQQSDSIYSQSNNGVSKLWHVWTRLCFKTDYNLINEK